MKLMIEIRMENAAFEDEPATEAARILRQLARDIAEDGAGAFDPGPGAKLRDSNGNTVGWARVED
jgi:hypothetical protein